MDDRYWHFWWFPWWMIFPLMWFAFGMFGMWMRHQRHQDMMRLFDKYAAQGKEPPPEMVEALSRSGRRGDWRDRDRDWGSDWWSYRYSRFGMLRRAVIMLSLAAAFFVMDYSDVINVHRENIHPFLIPAIILGAIGAGTLVMALFHPDRRDRLDDPNKRP